MLFNLAGSGGSGKSYVAMKLIRKYGLEPKYSYSYNVDTKEQKKLSSRPTYYDGQFDKKRMLFVLGGYNTACGGMDGVGTIDAAVQLIHRMAEKCPNDIIFYEGLMIGKSVGAVGALIVARYNERAIKGFLDTPIETCIERVRERRIKAGNEKPLDPVNLILDHKALQRARINCAAAGMNCVDIDHKHAYEEVVDIMKLGGVK